MSDLEDWDEDKPFWREANGMSNRYLMTEIYIRLRKMERFLDAAQTGRVETAECYGGNILRPGAVTDKLNKAEK